MLGVFGKIARLGLLTEGYPQRRRPVPESFRGRHRFLAERCDGCGACVPVCPAGAVAVGPGAAGAGREFSLGWDACVFCGRCADACPRDALGFSGDFELATADRSALRFRAACGTAPAPAAAAAPAPPAGVPAPFARSLHLRHLDAGSCNGCDFELTALLNPLYDVQRLGVDFVASPRHADGLVVTGPVTRNLREAVLRTWEATPAPRLVIAVGACACGGGIHGQSYATLGGVDRLIPVDVYVPGCPPRPEAILHGLLLAMGRATSRR